MNRDASPAAEVSPVRNVWLLAASFALVGTLQLVTVTLGGLSGEYLLGEDKSLATLPVAGFSIGLALATLPAAWWSQRVGRRAGLITGTGLAVAGGLVAATALWTQSFWLFAAGLFVAGWSGAFAQQHRFAAVEAVPADLRSLAISRVILGGLITAAAGPSIILLTRDLLAPTPFAGAFVVIAAIAGLSFLVLPRLRLPPRRSPAAEAAAGRRLWEIVRQPRFAVALLCTATAFALMALVMTAAPLAMVGHQHSQANAVLGIQWHVLAMFAPSLITGRLIARFGKERIVAVGLGLVLVSALVALAGLELLHFWGMLVLLGVGWNFSFVAGTAMLADTYAPVERARVEGFNDFVVFGLVALASFLSGQVLTTTGWNGLNIAVVPIVVVTLSSLSWLVLQERRRSP